MAKKRYLEESERKLIESVNNAYIPTDWDEFEKRYHEMERYGDGKPRKVDKEKMEYIEDGLVSRGVGGNQLSSLLSTIVEESGGNPFSVDDSGKFRGLIQFSKERYPEKDFSRDKKAGWKKAVDNQLDAIVDHLNEYGGDYGFLDGGDGSGYMTGEEAKDAFWGRDSDIENVTRALTYGFVRPGDRSGTTENRTRVARLINEIMQPPVETPDILEFDYDGKHYKATKPEEVTPEMRRALMLSKLVGEKNKVELQDSLYTTFNEAYGRAKNKGAGVFMWNGKKYSTKEEGGEVKEKESSSFLDVLKKSFRARTATANLVKDIFFGSEDGKPTELNRSLFSGVDPRGEVPNWSLPGIARAIDYAWDTLTAYIEGNYKDGLSEEYKDLPIADRVAINAWAKYNHLPYDKKLIIDNGDGTFRLPKEITGKIRTDKKQIERIYNTNKSLLEKAEKKYSNQIEQAKKNNELEKIPYISEQILSDPEIEMFKGALEMDKQNLAAMDSLDKNGKAVFNEFNYSGRNLRNEEDLPLLNVMGNHTIERDQNGNYRYKDIYDFWPWFDWMTRGNIFKIEGKVPHRKDGGRGALWTKGNEEGPEAHFYDTYKSTEMKEEGGETNAAEFSLPEVNIYPNNRFGDIARSQGLKTARQWMEVRNATTNGINDFVNDPRTQFVLGMLPLPMGVEGVEEISKLIKRAKDFRQISKDLRITPWMEQQLIDDAVEKANWRILEDEGALGQGRLITQQDRPSVELTLKPKSQKNSGEYASGRKFINNKLWWSHRKPFYWGATRDGSKRILYSIDGNNVDLVRAKDLDPEYPNSWVYLTDEVVLTDPKLNAKFFVPTEGGYFIPSSHYRFTQWKDDMVDMMNTVKPEEWAEFRDGGWTKEDENDFQKWYAKVAEYKGLNPDPDDAEQYYDYRTYWLENPEAARKMLEDDPEAHFTDRYKYPGHPTFSDESMYADEEHPGGHWETVDGIGYYVPSEYTKSYIDRTIQYLAGQNEGVYVDGEYRLIPKMPDGGASRLAPRDNTSVGRPGPADVQPVKPSAAARENPIVPFVASLLPGIGDVIDAHDFIQAAKDKNMVGMALAAAGFIPLVGDAFQEAARFTRGRRNSYVRYDAPPRRNDIKESDEELLRKMPDYARPGYPAMEALNIHRRRLSDGAYEQRTGQGGSEAKRELEGFAETFPGIYDRIFDLDYINEDDMEAARRVIEIIDKQPKGSAGTMSDEGVVKRLNDIKQRLVRSSPAFAEGTRGNAGIISLDNWSDFFMDEAYRSGISHELDHAVYLNTPEETIKELSGKVGDWFDSSRIENKNIRDYVSKPIELLARGTQIKDFYGLTDNAEKVTPEMLKFAARHYADNVMDNQMTEFFNGIKDWDKAAEWISKYSTATLPAIAVSKLLQDGKEKDEYPVNRRHGGPISEDGSVGGDYILDDGGRSLYRRSEYIKNRLLSKYNLLPEESDGIISDLIGKSSLDEKFYDPKHKAYGIGQWSGKDLKEFVLTYKDGGLVDQIDFLAKKYWDGFGKDGKGDIESGVFDEHRWVVKRIGNEEFYTNSPLLKTLPSMSREDVALSRLPLKFWPGVIKRRGDKTGVAARKHFLNGGETSELQDYIYDRLTQKHGIPPIQAIGIVANLTQESALNYDALGDNGRSYGIQQWQGDRRKKLFEFAKERGREEPALDDQIDFLVDEYNDNGFLFPVHGENMYKTGKTDKDMFDYFQYSKLDFDNAANIYDSTRAWAQGFGRGNKNFLNMDRRFHIAKTLSSRYNIDAGGQSFYTDMGYKDEWGSPVPEVAVSAEKKAAQDDWMEKYGNKMLASILAGDGEGGDTHVTNNYYVNEEGLSEDEKRNAAEVQELQQKQQAQELLASIIDGIKLDIKGVTEVRKR